MKKIVTLLICAMMLLSCSMTILAADYSDFGFIKKIPMKPKYTQGVDHQGTVETLTYTCHSYMEEDLNPGEEIIVEKNMLVYLPYGYDSSQEYNVLYLMHGGGEDEYYWLGEDRMGKPTAAVLDYLNENGECEPTIVVAPTTNLGRRLDGSENMSMEGAVNSSLITYFWQELVNDILPLIETNYSTFANGDVSYDNLVATRDHRAFAGFSMGSLTTVNVMQHCLDIMSYFGNYSGATARASDEDFFSAMESDVFKDLDIKFWYHGEGSNDIALDDQEMFCQHIFERMSDRVVDGENYAYVEFKGGTHAYNCWLPHLYNCMRVFFKK